MMRAHENNAREVRNCVLALVVALGAVNLIG